MNPPISLTDVRFYIMDRGSDDNPYLVDLAFTDEEILGAMRSVAREYNSIPPLGVDIVSHHRLPGDTNIFLDGIAAVLLRMEMLRRGRNDVDYSLAGASASTEATRLRHIADEQKLMQERFREAAATRKLTFNLYTYYGPIV